VFVGNLKVDIVKVNGDDIAKDKFSVSNNILTIKADVFEVGESVVSLSNGKQFVVIVEDVMQEIIGNKNKDSDKGCNGFVVGGCVAGGVAICCGAIITILLSKRKRKK
jgi:hypothetical protein